MDGRPGSVGTSFGSGVVTAQRSNAMGQARSPTEKILVTPDVVQAPHFTDQLTDQNAQTFLRHYYEYMTPNNRHYALGDEWTAVSLSALISMGKQHVLRSQFFRGHAFTDELLFDALEQLAEIVRDNRTFGAENFSVYVKRITKMGHRSSYTLSAQRKVTYAQVVSLTGPESPLLPACVISQDKPHRNFVFR